LQLDAYWTTLCDMRRLPAGSLVVVFVLALGVSSGLATRQPVVPLRVQRTVANLYGKEMAFVPRRLPAGYRFAGWSHSRKPSLFEYQVNLVKRDSTGAILAQVAFQVLRRPCPSAPAWGAQGYVRIDGRRIAWSRTNSDTYAWRCMTTAKGRSFVIFGMNGPVRTDAYLTAYATLVR
jgi:hypothetical protein